MSTLDGIWNGIYTYPIYEEPVPFSAWLQGAGPAISGSSLEPNTFFPIQDETLEAYLKGGAVGPSILLEKTYASRYGIVQPKLFYDGILSADGQQITGSWYFSSREDFTGVFEMERTFDPIRAAIKTSETAQAHDSET